MSRLNRYHLWSFGPVLFLLFLWNFKFIETALFVLLYLVHLLIYRPIVDYKKLKRKGLVDRNSFLRSLGFIRIKYLHELISED